MVHAQKIGYNVVTELLLATRQAWYRTLFGASPKIDKTQHKTTAYHQKK
jgi:hypothetical protein